MQTSTTKPEGIMELGIIFIDLTALVFPIRGQYLH